MKQETVSGSGMSWAICKSAPSSRQITTPAPHHPVFYRPDALPGTQSTASKHWRKCILDNLLIKNHYFDTEALSYMCCLQTFKNNSKNFLKYDLPSQVECLQYNNRLHMNVCFINFSRHSITVDRAHGTGLIILTQNSSQHLDTDVTCEITTVFSTNAIGQFRHLPVG